MTRASVRGPRGSPSSSGRTGLAARPRSTGSWRSVTAGDPGSARLRSFGRGRRLRRPTARAARRPSRSRARRDTARSRRACRPARGIKCGTASGGSCWDADWGAVTNETEQEGGPPSSSYAFLLDPIAIVGGYRLEAADEVEIAGRPARRPARGSTPERGGRDRRRLQPRAGSRRDRASGRRGAWRTATRRGTARAARPSTGSR